jgi:hypothetical protein
LRDDNGNGNRQAGQRTLKDVCSINRVKNSTGLVAKLVRVFGRHMTPQPAFASPLADSAGRQRSATASSVSLAKDGTLFAAALWVKACNTRFCKPDPAVTDSTRRDD